MKNLFLNSHWLRRCIACQSIPRPTGTARPEDLSNYKVDRNKFHQKFFRKGRYLSDFPV